MRSIRELFRKRDTRWLVFWLASISAIGTWGVLFLNAPALKKVITGFINTFVIALMVIVVTLFLGWGVTLILNSLESRRNRSGFLIASFLLNLIRSVPQIVGVLFGYIIISSLVTREHIRGQAVVFMLMAVCMSIFVFLELVDLMRERIAHYKSLDFYNAMRVCAIPESRIVNFDILWKNSRVHIFNKLISVFGMAVFLQCSVDFIISVGLSTGISEVSLPTTLGSLLASIDSKQDILAVGHALTHPDYFVRLPFQHLQGITVAFLIVFTLLSIYHIANGYAERHRL